MKQIIFILQPHLYAEERPMDWAFDNTECCGVLSPEDFGALWNHRNYHVQYSFDEQSTIGDAVKFIVNVLIEDIYDDEDQLYYSLFRDRVFFWGNGERFFPENHKKSFIYLLDKYLDPKRSGIVYVDILARMDAGRVWLEDSLRYDMHAREGIHHNEPHVHVRDIQSNQEASISLYSQKVLAGDLPKKLLKKAKSTVKKKQDYFINCWNEKTDGLVADINRYLGLIQY